MDYAASERVLKGVMGFLLYLCFILFIINECRSDETNPCVWEETCGKCIQKDPRCTWCSQEDFTERNISRCDLMETLQEKNCSDLVNPTNSLEDTLSLPLSEVGVRAASAVQVKPLVTEIELRPNSPEQFSFEFRQAVPYPIDLYYLMDLSHTMQNHEEKLKRLGQKLGQEIDNISTNFTIGVGSFMDKVVPVYGSNTDNKFPAQGFNFNTDLLLNTAAFAKKVGEVIKSMKTIHDPSNVWLKAADNLTGTLDVIMQAIVCKDEIKWRPDSKKLIVIATGNDFHYAGDGKLKGIVEPNDGECHLNSGGYYNQQDYPSFSQINKKIMEHNITTIFAVTDEQMEAYGNISSRINGSIVTELDDVSRIVELIREEYEAISSSIEISDTARDSEIIEISYNSACSNGENMKDNVCKDVKPEDTITINATIKLLRCPENSADWNQKIDIQPVRRISTLSIYLKMICDCSCTDRGQEKNERFCSGNGTYGCGICHCDNNRYGEQCECEGADNQTRPDINQCIRGKNGRICSNRGVCRCGKCECGEGENPGEKYYGRYCECSNFTCYRVNNKICNGHGRCECGRCNCDDGWSGPDCTCSNSTENCLVSSDGSMCSGHGTCYCGSCKCDETYYGQFCEDCPNCPGKCEEYGACVKCVLSKQGEYEPEEYCKEDCKTLMVVLIDTMDQVNLTHTEKICPVEDEDGCRTFFKYEKEDNNKTTIIYAQRERECPTAPDIVAIVAGTIGSIVAAGLILLLLWKFLTYVHDKKEYAKFEKEVENAKWDAGENPFFIEPTSTFQNPAYRRN